LGRLLSFLESSGQRDQTIVVFTSDHGETLGDHGLVQKGCRFYEGLVRVPLIFQGPGIVPGRQRAALVELLDMSATLLELAGVPLPEHHQGRSLTPLLTDARCADQHRDFVRCEYYDALAGAFCGGAGSYATMYRDHRHKIVSYHDAGLGELYDLLQDPWEFDDLWDDPRAQPDKLRLLEANFNASMLCSIDVGTRRIAPM
jgi:arylsulfatase A-like enzyme